MAIKDQYPDLASLMLFNEIAAGRTFAEAAKKYGITVSAVSQIMKQLEKDVGAELFDRSVRPLSVTVYGRNLARITAPAMKQLENLKSAVRPSSDHYPSVRIGLAESVSQSISPWILRDLTFRADAVTAKTGMTRALLEDFTNKELDVLVSAGLPDKDEDIIQRAIYTEDFFIVSPKEWPHEICCSADVHRLADTLPLIRYNALAADRIQTERIFRRENIPTARVLEVESSYSMLGLIADGRGWSFMPPFNIWHGSAFARQVNFSRISSLKLQRKMWVTVRGTELSGLLEVIASSAASAVAQKMIPRLEALSPALARGVQLL